MSDHKRQLRLDREAMERMAAATMADRFTPWRHGILRGDEPEPKAPQETADTEKK